MVTAVAFLAGLFTGIRWLRVAQREHYLPWSVSRFAIRWWRLPENIVVLLLGSAAAVVDRLGDGGDVVAVGLLTLGPLGLSWRGRTSKLAWTRRMMRLAGAGSILLLALAATLAAVAPAATWAIPVVAPLLVDLALLVTGPLERRFGQTWVDQASATLSRSGVRTVAITGSYGKTSTKQILGALLGGLVPTLVSPASFNNRMGLARTINEHLSAGTEVFVAEMGTYGQGEIKQMCKWVNPEVGIITALGPVHLERMKTLETIAKAKREIVEAAKVGVINIDYPLLADIAVHEAKLRRIVTVSCEDSSASVFLDPVSGVVRVDGASVGLIQDNELHPGNVACAIGGVVALGFDPAAVLDRIGAVATVAHRQEITRSESGVLIIDNTFNSNPAGARAALAALSRAGSGRRVMVTPGMVELGSSQYEENHQLASEASAHVSDLVVVGRTNRRALLLGAREAGLASVIVVADRSSAVGWVKENLSDGDAVLYENDLPDHFV